MQPLFKVIVYKSNTAELLLYQISYWPTTAPGCATLFFVWRERYLSDSFISEIQWSMLTL